MCQRLLTAILITAIVGCPALCGQGLCQAGFCAHGVCALDHGSTGHVADHEAAHDDGPCHHGGCGKGSRPEPAPCPPDREPPQGAVCQCISGGAVVEKAIVWAPVGGPTMVVDLPCDVAPHWSDGRAVESTFRDDLLPDLHWGRYLRALYASLLL